ncbi:MAG: Prepilin-type N-terminal cleavage/methylation protein [Hydrocarboniphaga sp.]|uniref:PilW family protein n=1 Tax=Hydrocarboniphaga sp. TaxID=2033016 RepID=UPI0026245A81|nr:PilW family protein [Hydrocarboniphaga sp.]MDB5968805.1 Prepilin-type N-terminal cleavage/methylation protein [Hydrocarboniphaga sp.]
MSCRRRQTVGRQSLADVRPRLRVEVTCRQGIADLRAARPSRQAGLTLVELMISLVLGLILVTAVGTLFVYTNRSNRQNELIAGMQDQARFALATLSRDITMAGYWGGIASAATITPNTNDLDATNDASTATAAFPAANDCGVDATTRWAFELTRKLSYPDPITGITQILMWPSRIEFRNQSTSGAPSAMWRCIGDYKTGTDVVALRRVAGQQTGCIDSANTTDCKPGSGQVKLRAYNYYLQTNGVVGTLMRWSSADTATPGGTEQPLSAPMNFFRYVPRIYYVRNYSHTSGDGIPTLCRKELCSTGYTAGSDNESGTCGAAGASATASGFYSECLAEGVEDLQIVWGVANADGSGFRYTSTPSAQEVATNAQTAQIFLRMRSARSDGSYTDTKTYTAGDGSAYTSSGSDQHFYRRIYSTTVYLRNPAR